MAVRRAHEAEQLLNEEPPLAEPLVNVSAGESLLVRVAAVDHKSGVAEIVASCRSRENHELCSSGTWSPRCGRPRRGENYYSIVIPIPRRSPTAVWEMHAIILCDAEGNRRTCHAGIDFEEMLFRVEGVEGIDCTPPRLLGVRFGRA